MSQIDPLRTIAISGQKLRTCSLRYTSAPSILPASGHVITEPQAASLAPPPADFRSHKPEPAGPRFDVTTIEKPVPFTPLLAPETDSGRTEPETGPAGVHGPTSRYPAWPWLWPRLADSSQELRRC